MKNISLTGSNCTYSTFFKILLFIVGLNLVYIGSVFYIRSWQNSRYEPPKPSVNGFYSKLYKLIKAYRNVSHSNTQKDLEEEEIKKLNQNIVFRKFHIKEPKKRTKVDIIMIVSTAPARSERRSAIRETWWLECQSTKRVTIKCVFLTDVVNKSTHLGRQLMKEEEKFKDLFFQDLLGGFDFGKRFLYHIMWALINFDFQYFLRMDDDYFLCIKRFLLEVPMPPKPLYHWGWVHCQNDIVRPEESIILLSKDLIKKYAMQDPELMYCHRWADQMIGVWKNEMNLYELKYNHDPRLHHDPPVRVIGEFRAKKNICQDYIGIHGSYPIQMRTLWKHKGPDEYPTNRTLFDYAAPCTKPNIMRWQNFGPEWLAEPKLCKTDPDWGGEHGTTYLGRQGNR